MSKNVLTLVALVVGGVVVVKYVVPALSHSGGASTQGGGTSTNGIPPSGSNGDLFSQFLGMVTEGFKASGNYYKSNSSNT